MLEINDMFWVRSSIKCAQPEGTLFHQQTLHEFGRRSSYEAALVLILIGAGDILDATGRVLFRCRKNLGILGGPVIGVRMTKKKLLAEMHAAGLDDILVDKYIQRSRSQQAYYKEILLELVHYFWRTSSGQHTIAFLHLYRFLERISYVFPMAYAMKSDDFRGTFDSLKSYVNGDKSGELKFFQNFIEVALDQEQLDSNVHIDFNQLSARLGAEACGILRRNLDSDSFVGDPDATGAVIKCRSLIVLLINIRNRFFHATSGHRFNITMNQVDDPDKFFMTINGAILNWLSVVYFNTLSAKSERYS